METICFVSESEFRWGNVWTHTYLQLCTHTRISTHTHSTYIKASFYINYHISVYKVWVNTRRLLLPISGNSLLVFSLHGRLKLPANFLHAPAYHILKFLYASFMPYTKYFSLANFYPHSLFSKIFLLYYAYVYKYAYMLCNIHKHMYIIYFGNYVFGILYNIHMLVHIT